MVTFSVVIPVYNVSKYLRLCINSVLAQSYRDFEVILVNDGSTDGSGTICEEYTYRDNRVRVINQQNKGSSAARNVGISAATGDYVLFLDSDDYWKSHDVLEKIAKRIELTKPAVLSFNYEKFDGEKHYSPYFKSETMPLPITNSFQYQSEKELWVACAWNKAVRREIFTGEALRFREGITSEDVDWCIRLALEAENFDYLDSVVVCYRQREQSISRNVSARNVEILKENICYCLSILEESKGNRVELLKPYIAYQFATFLFHLAALTESEEKNILIKQAKEMCRLLKWSQNRKAKILDWATNLGGLTLTLWLLRLKSRRGF